MSIKRVIWICFSINLLLLLCVFEEIESQQYRFDQRPVARFWPVGIPNHHQRQQFPQVDQRNIYVQFRSGFQPPKAINGQRCSLNQNCQSGCCVLDEVMNQRSCAPMSKRNERCTVSQIKGGLYNGFCPCDTGSDVCKFIPELSVGMKRWCVAQIWP